MVFPNVDASSIVGEALLFLNSAIPQKDESLSGPIEHHVHPIGLWFRRPDIEELFVNGPSFGPFRSERFVQTIHAFFLVGLIAFTAYTGINRTVSSSGLNIVTVGIVLSTIHVLVFCYTLTSRYLNGTTRHYTLVTSFIIAFAGASKTMMITGIIS